MKKIHGTKFEPSKLLPGINDPDVNDPNNRWSSSNKTYPQKNTYYRHLIDFHNLIVSPASKRRSIFSNTIPAVDLLKRYCDVCDRRYTELRSYRNHLSQCHGIEPHRYSVPQYAVNRNVKPEISNIENYCTACGKILSSRQGYKIRVRRIHGMLLPKLHQINHDITPDIYDKNHYCTACDRTYASRASLRNHLSHTHKMKIKEI